jgi:hypothetical protein
MHARTLLLGLLVSLPIGALVAACSSSIAATAPPADVDAGEASAPAATTSWPGTACGACVATGCGPQRQVCDTEPSCAAHTACADKCAAAPDGAIDAACLAACPSGENSVASKARAAYDACLVESGPKACTACPKPPGEPPPPNDVLEQQCGASADPNACFKCEDTKCCHTYDACVAEPECKLQLQPCLKACGADGTAACRSQCYAAHPKGVAAWARRSTCIDTNCITACGGPQPDACFECAFLKECRDPHARCSADEGCFLLLACLDTDCPDVTDACVKSCKAKVPASAGPLFDAWFACTSVSCSAICA